MTSRKQNTSTTEESENATSQVTSNPLSSAASVQSPAERAIALFEANRAVRATSWILPRVAPSAAASEPHASTTAAIN
jgi:hypothetical protein